MKYIVETTGDFMLHSLERQGSVEPDRPSVVIMHTLLERWIASGKARVLGEVTDDATDAAFADTLAQCEGDVALAVPAFMSEFPPLPPQDLENEVTEEKEVPAKKGRKAKEGQ